MKKLMLTALAAAGCMSGGPAPQPIAATSQAVTAAPSQPGELRNLPRFRTVVPGSTGGGGSTGDGGTSTAWQALKNQPTFFAGISLLLTDGTVMVQDAGTANWWKLTPDAKGSYLNGTWSQRATMPEGYAPLYFASAVLPDGRVIVEGGEYQALQPAWTTQGAIYDPAKDQWTLIAPPAGWSTIGDAQSAVLADGRFVLANCCTTESAVLDSKTLTWKPFGTGKADINDEEGWTLLTSGKLLTVDANNVKSPRLSEIFSPATGAWTSAGDTGVMLADLSADGGGSHELGPLLLRPDGTVFAAGATGHSAVYHQWTGKWTAGPDFPIIAGEGQLDVADGPAALLPNGHVMVVASAGVFNSPAHVFEFDGTTLTEIGAPPGAAFDSSYNVNLLVLPTGEILYTDFSNDVEIYAPAAGAEDCWAPEIESELETLAPGKSYRIDGVRLNGLSQAVSYGDDVQAATNYPLVRITNRNSGHVVYARTHGHSSMGIGRQTRSHTFFDVPATLEPGESELVVVANGLASAPVDVEVAGATE